MANYTRELVQWKRTVRDINTRIVMTTDDFFISRPGQSSVGYKR